MRQFKHIAQCIGSDEFECLFCGGRFRFFQTGAARGDDCFVPSDGEPEYCPVCGHREDPKTRYPREIEGSR